LVANLPDPTVFIDWTTALPIQVESLLDEAQLIDAMAQGDFFTWGQRVMANNCISAPMGMTDNPCLASNDFDWTDRHTAGERLSIEIPDDYVEIVPRH